MQMAKPKPSGAPDAAQDVTTALRRRYVGRMAGRIDRIEACLTELRTGTLSADSRRYLTEEAHDLSGSGGSFGFWEISREGRALEDLLLANAAAASDILKHAETLLEALRAAETAGEPEAEMDLPPPATDSFARVLIIDNDDSMRDLLESLIGNAAEVVTADDIDTGRLMIEALEPDLVLLDNRLAEDGDGLALLEALQEDPRLATIPVVMITASDEPGEVMRGLMAGAVDYIVKPFDAADVGRKIRSRLRRLDSHILIAEDDDTVREMLVHSFQSAGCRVTAVANGRDAWDAVSRENYSVALVDWMMPGLDGVALLRLMKSQPETAKVPVVFLTARHYGADVLEGLNTGAVDYITKPFSADEVLARVLRLLKETQA